MTFSKKAILLSGILLCISVQLGAQVRQTREEYISRYMPIAIAHMERYGIPASITMAQGILESDCGNSLRATPRPPTTRSGSSASSRRTSSSCSTGPTAHGSTPRATA